MVSIDFKTNRRIIGIYPWVDFNNDEGDKHQTLFADALESFGYGVKKITYQKGFPLRHALKSNVDVLVLDWVHSFYTSQSTFHTILKSILGILELIFLNKGGTKIIWNLHNLQRHDGKFHRIEKFCFQQLAKKVDYIRVFDKSHIDKVSNYLRVPSEKLVAISQGPYTYQENIDVDLYQRYGIAKNKNILLFFGSIREGKGLEMFLKSFINCKAEDWVLLIAGKAFNEDLRKEVEAICDAHTNIYFSNGFIPDKEVKSYFKGAKALVLPYTKTLNSGVLLLAKSYGTLVLATENFKNLVRDSDIVGNLFDSDELKRLLSTVGNKKSNKATNKAFLWQDVVNQFEKLF